MKRPTEQEEKIEEYIRSAIKFGWTNSDYRETAMNLRASQWIHEHPFPSPPTDQFSSSSVHGEEKKYSQLEMDTQIDNAIRLCENTHRIEYDELRRQFEDYIKKSRPLPVQEEKKDTIRVRITKQPDSGQSWYMNAVGKEFDVVEDDYHKDRFNIKSDTLGGNIAWRYIDKTDCEVLSQPPPQKAQGRTNIDYDLLYKQIREKNTEFTSYEIGQMAAKEYAQQLQPPPAGWGDDDMIDFARKCYGLAIPEIELELYKQSKTHTK